LIEMSQQRHPIAGQDPANGRSWDTEVVADAVWSPSPAMAQFDDPSLEALKESPVEWWGLGSNGGAA
jgi:hypothetical protein